MFTHLEGLRELHKVLLCLFRVTELTLEQAKLVLKFFHLFFRALLPDKKYKKASIISFKKKKKSSLMSPNRF